MTTEQFNAIMGELGEIRDTINNKLKWVTPLVGDGKIHPKAPTAADVAMDPKSYYGTPFDPLPASLRISSTAVIERFQSPKEESNPDRFVGGTIGEWYKRDPMAALLFLANTLQGNQINTASLHLEQRKVLFGS